MSQTMFLNNIVTPYCTVCTMYIVQHGQILLQYTDRCQNDERMLGNGSKNVRKWAAVHMPGNAWTVNVTVGNGPHMLGNRPHMLGNRPHMLGNRPHTFSNGSHPCTPFMIGLFRLWGG